MRKALIAVPAAVLLLAACSSSGKNAQSLGPGATSSSPSSSPSSSAAAGASAEASTLGAPGLAPRLLTVHALPAGWTTVTASAAGGVASCKALNNGAWLKLPAEAEVGFQDGESGFIDEKLASGSGSQVALAWTSFAAATSECRSFTSGSARFTLQQLSFPGYGDATYAFAIAATESGVSVSGDIVVVRVGNTLVQMITLGVPDIPVALVEQATAAAVAKAK